MKVIFHVDMDAFFASCEIIQNKKLKNQPVVVSSNKKRAVVSTANYIARQYGIKSAMPLYLAKKKCNKLIILNNNKQLYENFSNKILNILKKYTNKIYIASIDEWYLDVTEQYKKYKNAKTLAKVIKLKILNFTGLDASIGISYKPKLAKIASKIAKPSNIFIITPSNIESVLFPLKIDYINGIGKCKQAVLNKINIYNCKELYRAIKNHKINNKIMKEEEQISFLNIIDDLNSPELIQNHQSKSFSKEITFDNYLSDRFNIIKILQNIMHDIDTFLIQNQYVTKCLKIKIKYDINITKTYQKKLNTYSSDAVKIFQEFLWLFENNWNKQPIRLIGLSISNLIYLFNDKKQLNLLVSENASKINKIINEINKKYKKPLLYTINKK